MSYCYAYAKKPETHINSLITVFEKSIAKYGSINVQNTENQGMKEIIYEFPSKGGIIAKFSNNNVRFRINNKDQSVIDVDMFLTYLGFDETSKEYKKMITDVTEALKGL